jgi:DNA-binding transcriptional regulator PaaX
MQNELEMRQYHLNPRGMTPSPSQGGKLRKWRLLIAREAKKKYQITEELQRQLAGKRFELTITFHFLDKNLNSDLDNLVKPIMDTLFFNRYAKLKKLTGRLFKYTNDAQVFVLFLSKDRVTNALEEGASIHIVVN